MYNHSEVQRLKNIRRVKGHIALQLVAHANSTGEPKDFNFSILQELFLDLGHLQMDR